MKSELLIKMTASVAVLSASTVGLGSMVDVKNETKDTSGVVALEAEREVGGLEYELDNAINDMDYTSLAQAISTSGSKVKTLSLKSATVSNKNAKYSKMFVAKTNSYISIKKSASSNSDTVGKLYNGYTGTVLAKGSSYVKIKSGNVTGYVNKNSIITGLSDANFLKKARRKLATVKSSTLRVRQKQSTSSKVITTLKKGQVAAVVSENKKWARIRRNGKILGYVSKTYISTKLGFEYAVACNIKASTTTATKTTTTTKTSSSSDSNVVIRYDTPIGNLTKKEYKYLACITFCEAGDESKEPHAGRIGVINVIMNRVKSKNFANDVVSVIMAKGQFSPTWNGMLDRELKYYDEGKYSTDKGRKECVRALEDAIKGANAVGTRLYFNGYNEAKDKGHKDTLKIGTHLFWQTW